MIKLGLSMILIAALIFLGMNFNLPANVYSFTKPPEVQEQQEVMQTLILPKTHETEVEGENTIIAEVTAYNPISNQTDDTPFINAMGLKVQKGDIANNCLPFGTKVEIDNKIYIIRDRMNPRYNCKHFDIFMWDYQEAKNFGRQIKNIKIYEKNY